MRYLLITLGFLVSFSSSCGPCAWTLRGGQPVVAWGGKGWNGDTMVGRATFKVEKSSNHGEDVTLLPLMTPSLRAHRISDAGELSDTIVRCEIVSRIMSVDEDKANVFTVTVLRCNKVEYGVGEIDFVMDEHADQMLEPENSVSKP